MKSSYKIDYEKRKITLSHQFMKKAETDITSDEYRQLECLRGMGMRMIYPKKKKSKELRLTIAEMHNYINAVENHEYYLKDFAAVRDGCSNNYMKIWSWFKQTFPNYGKPIMLNARHEIIVLPPEEQTNNLSSIA